MEYFIQIIAATLNIDNKILSSSKEIDSLGIDSLYAAALQNRLMADLNIDWPMTRFLQGGTIVDLVLDAVMQSTPKGVLDHITRIISEQRRIFENKANSFELATSAPSKIYPLSYNQKAIWFAHQAERGNSAYHLSIKGRFINKIDQNIWKLAWDTLLSRHRVLRSYFYIDENILRQENEEEFKYENYGSIIQLKGEKNQLDVEIRAKMHELANQSFSLENTFPIRVHLIVSNSVSESSHLSLLSDAEESQFLLTVHHIASDLASMLIIVKEFTEIYNHFVKKGKSSNASTLQSLEYHYFDYIRNQESYLESKLSHEDWIYWNNKLTGDELPIISLPTDFERKTEGYESGIYQFKINSEITAKIQDFTKKYGVTLYMFLLSNFYMLIYRLTSETDLIVGSPAAVRNKLEHQNIVGCMINLLPLRINISEATSFEELLKLVQKTVLEGIEHQNYPFQLLLEKLPIGRMSNHTPIFQLLFSYLELRQLPELSIVFDENSVAIKQDDLKCVLEQFPKQNTAYELSMVVEPWDDSLRVSIEYARNLFADSSVENIANCFHNLIQNSLTAYDTEIARISMMTNDECLKITKHWNETFCEYPSDDLLSRVFSSRAQISQDAIAIQCSKGQITYQELEQKSNYLAQYLIEKQLSSTLIAILLDRTCEMVVALLAVLKSGSAFLPLDTAIPSERQHFIIEDAGVQAAISTRNLAKGIESKLNTIIYLDGTDDNYSKIKPLSTVAPNLQISPDSTAYVIYTSGSTGKPKGVAVSHRSVINLLYAMQQHLALTPQDAWLAVTTLIFDISILEIFLPLIVGAKIYLIENDKTVDGHYLSNQLDNGNISIVQATPSTWRLLIDSGWKGNSSLKVLVGGEALTFNLAEELLLRSGSCWNVYGPTEATIWATLNKITHEYLKVSAQLKYIPIGRPLNNLKIYILDKFLQPVPIGVAGELYIGGVGVAKGYLNRETLNQERFILD